MKNIRIINLFNAKIFSIFLAICLIVALVPSRSVFADANQLAVINNSGTVYLNSPLTVTIKSYVDSPQATGTAIGTLTFPANRLMITGYSTSGSSYGSPTITPGSGTLNFNASRSSDSSGFATIFTVTFKAIGAGSAQIGFTSDSKVNGISTNYVTGSYTIVDPNPPSPSPSTKPSTSPKPSTTPKSSPTPTPTDSGGTVQTTPDPSGLIDGVSVVSLYSTSTITWSVNATNPGATLSYGLNSSQLDHQGTVTRKSDGSFTVTLTGLTPGLRYAFTISATGAGGKSSTYSGTIPLRGFPVTLNITENDQPVQSGQVKIGNQTALITTPGKLTIGLAAGTYSITITTDTATLTKSLVVTSKPIPADGSTPDAQTFSYNLTSSPLEQGPGSGFSILIFVGVLFGGLVILALGFVGFMAYRRRQFENGGGSTYNDTPTVIIDDGYDWSNHAQK